MRSLLGKRGGTKVIDFSVAKLFFGGGFFKLSQGYFFLYLSLHVHWTNWKYLENVSIVQQPWWQSNLQCFFFSPQFNRFHWITWHGADLLGLVQLGVTWTGKCCSVLSNRIGLSLQQRGKCRQHWQLQWLQVRLNSPCGSKQPPLTLGSYSFHSGCF